MPAPDWGYMPSVQSPLCDALLSHVNLYAYRFTCEGRVSQSAVGAFSWQHFPVLRGQAVKRSVLSMPVHSVKDLIGSMVPE